MLFRVLQTVDRATNLAAENLKIENSIFRSGLNDQTKKLGVAVDNLIAAGKFRTPDIGGTSSATKVSAANKTELQQ
jgi:hypothetical protein